MHGNVYEWTQDAFSAYSSAAVTDPLMTSGTDRVHRGGTWSRQESFIRSAHRGHNLPGFRYSTIGFRLSFSTPTSHPDLNSTTALTIAENQPAGTIVGEFNATDPEGDTITYQLIGERMGFTHRDRWYSQTATTLITKPMPHATPSR